MSGNLSLSGVLYMYVHIYTHMYKTHLCLLLYEIGIYLSDMQAMKRNLNHNHRRLKEGLKLETKV